MCGNPNEPREVYGQSEFNKSVPLNIFKLKIIVNQKNLKIRKTVLVIFLNVQKACRNMGAKCSENIVIIIIIMI